MRTLSIITVFLTLCLAGGIPFVVRATEGIRFLVISENGIGSSAHAQPYLDRLLASLAKQTQWPTVQGKYMTSRERALSHFEKEPPHFGILSLGAFLYLNERQKLTVIGQVDVPLSGGQRYFIVSKRASSLKECKGQILASNHLQDRKFIESVVAKQAFRLNDFQVVQTRRPVQTLKKVIRDEASCAVIDNAQLNATSKIQGGGELQVVWKSRKLPPIPVVAFTLATYDQIEKLKKALPKLCSGDENEICKAAGILSMKRSSDAIYRQLIREYR